MQTDPNTPRHRALARGLIDKLNRRVIAVAAERQQGTERGRGDRAPAGLAQPRRSLVALTEPLVTDKGVIRAPVTPLGYRTAVRALPPVLADLEVTDRRRHVADMLADAYERVGAVGGANLDGGSAKAGCPDGGVTTKIKHAARLSLIERLANGWPLDPRTGEVLKGPERIAMRVQRRNGKLQHIKAFPLLVSVCVEGQSLASVLTAHGWRVHAENRKRLGAALLELLDEVAEGCARRAERR